MTCRLWLPSTNMRPFSISNVSPGNITVEEFARVMKESGQNPSDEEVQQIIKEVDLDGDGTINFDGQYIPCSLSEA